MFSRWFRSNRLQHADPQIRLQAILDLDDEQAQKQEPELVRLAVSDDAFDVRHAALQRVTRPNQLAVLLDDDVIAEHAAAHIAKLISKGVAAECADHKHVVAARINLASTEEIPVLLKSISDAQLLAELAVKLRDPERAKILEHPLLCCEQGLATLERTARGRDKFCNRYARAQLEALKQAKAACAQGLERVAELDQAISKELKNQPQAAEELIAQRQKLSKLGDMRQQAAAGLQAAAATLAAAGGDTSPYQVAADPLRDVDLFIPDADNDPFTALVGSFEKLAADMRAAMPLTEVTARRGALAEAWLSHADKFPPSRSQHQVFEQVSAQYQAYQAAWQRYAANDWPAAAEHEPSAEQRQHWRRTWRSNLQHLNWPDAHTPPAAVQTIRARLATLDDELQRSDARRKADRERLQTLLESAGQAVADGHVADATRCLKEARQLYRDGVKDKKIEQTLNTLSAEVSELRDWQKFATAPKRRQLIEQLQQISTTPLQPPQQAEQLRALRAQWQQLGRPANSEEAQLQKQFDSLAEQAYEPCKAYYQSQSEARAENLRQRQAICEQLHTYLENTDWARAEIKAAESILRTARETWRQYHPCERKALKPVQAEFEALQEQLHAHIKTAWDKNVSDKKRLVEEARALLDQPLQEQINGAKHLQQMWREVGPTPRTVDQRLWRDFREICDQIFAQRDAGRQAAEAEQSKLRDELEAAVRALQHAAETTPVQQATAATQRHLNETVDDLSRQLQPSRDQRRRIDEANRGYANLLQQARRQQAHERLQQWQAWDEQVSEAERQGTALEAPDPVFSARLHGQAEPEDWLQLTLTAEIAADLPAPPEHQNQRMALQIELMNAGIRQFSDADKQELLRRWCAAGPKDASGEELRARFFRAISHQPAD